MLSLWYMYLGYIEYSKYRERQKGEEDKDKEKEPEMEQEQEIVESGAPSQPESAPVTNPTSNTDLDPVSTSPSEPNPATSEPTTPVAQTTSEQNPPAEEPPVEGPEHPYEGGGPDSRPGNTGGWKEKDLFDKDTPPL